MAENDDDSSASVTETQFVTADYTELCLVTFGCLCLVGLAAGLAWYFIFYDPTDKDSDRHRANYTQLPRRVPDAIHLPLAVISIASSAQGGSGTTGNGTSASPKGYRQKRCWTLKRLLENAANKFSREDYARSLHFVPSDANSSHFEIGNASSSFVIQPPVTRNRRSRRQSLEASAIGKAAAMFALCKDVVDKKQSEINKLSDFTRIFTPFPNVETMDAAKALKLMVELSLAWKINIMFAVDVFADHDEGGRPTVSISENREELSDWLSLLFIHVHTRLVTQVLAKKLTKDIRKEFKAIFRKTPWMDASTRTAALDKMEDMGEVLVKPEFLDDEEALDERYANFSVHEDYLTTSLHAASASTHRAMNALVAGESVARRSFSPLEVNAFYERELNAMFVSAAIMQPPYLAEKAWTAFNYAGLGAVVGHEVMHGFDDRGKDRNARGELDDWWTPDVLRAYQEKVACFQRSYGDAADGLMEENVADFRLSSRRPRRVQASLVHPGPRANAHVPGIHARAAVLHKLLLQALLAAVGGKRSAAVRDRRTAMQRTAGSPPGVRRGVRVRAVGQHGDRGHVLLLDVLIPQPSIDEEPLNNQPDSYLLRAATG
ncbi:hypothetical protein HPB48_019625 [Haemaphysalis longicornis]|uniref:Peptidase M13 C-terminal domain-containing protein n=1 Tax=Haemaphysalis longicornis TaxID=44386 RepID=A0A9J6FQL3_HAELO|nr:hypothetical protein HPB48_019625 [Haemaphysalis longicornis]